MHASEHPENIKNPIAEILRSLCERARHPHSREFYQPVAASMPPSIPLKKAPEVILASHGDVALALVCAERPDVVFLDVNMPGKNGLDVCVELRTHPPYQPLPIYIVTGLDRSVYADHAGASCATACLTKPLKSRSLLNLLARTAESL